MRITLEVKTRDGSYQSFRAHEPFRCRPFVDDGHNCIVHGSVPNPSDLDDLPGSRMNLDRSVGGDLRRPPEICLVVTHAKDR